MNADSREQQATWEGLARRLHDAWCEEFNPDPSWPDEDEEVQRHWVRVAQRVFVRFER